MSKNVATSPSWRFKSMRATFSFDIWASSTARFTAIEVFPIPPLFENVEMILQESVVSSEQNSFFKLFITSVNSVFMTGFVMNSFAPALIALMIVSVDALFERATIMDSFLFSLIVFIISRAFSGLSDISISTMLFAALITKLQPKSRSKNSELTEIFSMSFR